MAAKPLTEAASEALLASKEELARSITTELYQEMPELLEKYGERGRVRCHEDMLYNLEHLAPAVALDEPVLFARYVEWLRDMLAARGIPAGEVRRSLEITRDRVRTRFPADQAKLIAAVLEAGLNALGPAN